MTQSTSDLPSTSDLSTQYALDRTVLANERTYAAWLRTGMAALATGIGVEKFMIEVIPEWGIKLIAVLLLAFSAIAFLLAAWRFNHLGVRLEGVDVKMIPRIVTAVLSAALALCSVLALLCLVLPSAG